MNEMHSMGERQQGQKSSGDTGKYQPKGRNNRGSNARDNSRYIIEPEVCLEPGSSVTTERESSHGMLYFAIGDFVIHPDQPDWGLGQIQSIVRMNVTVNFPNVGKQLINCDHIELVKINLDEWKNGV